MKSKIVIFRALAAIIAVVGAIASVSANSALVVTSAYVHYTTASNQTVRQYCTISGGCDSAGSGLCTIRVVIGSAPFVNYQGKDDACGVVLTDNSSTDVDGTKNIPLGAVLIP